MSFYPFDRFERKHHLSIAHTYISDGVRDTVALDRYYQVDCILNCSVRDEAFHSRLSINRMKRRKKERSNANFRIDIGAAFYSMISHEYKQ
jgi:hypothetical protein